MVFKSACQRKAFFAKKHYESKVFPIHTTNEYKKAERYQQKLYKKYNKVNVKLVRRDTILISGSDSHER